MSHDVDVQVGAAPQELAVRSKLTVRGSATPRRSFELALGGALVVAELLWLVGLVYLVLRLV